MSPDRTHSQLSNTERVLLSDGTALTTNGIIRRSIGRGLLRVTSRTSSGLSAIAEQGEFGTTKNYCELIQTGRFWILLFDGAIIQVSYDFSRGSVYRHRLCYVPCPFALDRELLMEEPILDVLDTYLSGELDSILLRGPLRFDYDASQVSESHSPCHLHLLHGSCRIPVFAPIGVGSFIAFIFRLFYPTIWAKSGFLRQLHQEFGDRTISEEDEGFFYFNRIDRASIDL